MRAFVKGMLARSKAGHDTGKLFVVMQAEEEFVSGRRPVPDPG